MIVARIQKFLIFSSVLAASPDPDDINLTLCRYVHPEPFYWAANFPTKLDICSYAYQRYYSF